MTKVDYEGGLSSAFAYGLRPSDIDPNTDADGAFTAAVLAAHEAWKVFAEKADALDEIAFDYEAI